ncbi:MAG: hypothetical protein NC086_09745, partial [Alistipes sp.]|nr:hypothetical protein [Alistipes sp.]
HKEGTTFYHLPCDLEPYLIKKKNNTIYTVMIDWDRYDISNLPECDGKTVDAVRVVFPHGKYHQAIEIGRRIKEKGYLVFFQAANTLAYTDQELIDLAVEMNKAEPEAVSVVDTFGAMYEEDLERIVKILDEHLNKNIQIGFHSHNNQQLSFALTIHFIRMFSESARGIIVDSSLCGMGRGAGNTTTELMVNFLNRKFHKHYNMDAVMDAIDTYMGYYQENYKWGYSTPYFIAGMYCCHVNNIAYLLENHRTGAKDMRNIIESMSREERQKYDYDLLEQKYINNQSRYVDDTIAVETLKNVLKDRRVLLIAPGKSIVILKDKIKAYIQEQKPVVIGINAVISDYQEDYDYIFFVNPARYDYARQNIGGQFPALKKILLSNVKSAGEENEYIIDFNHAIKRGWEHFDNAAVCCLRLMDYLHMTEVSIAGFDGFKDKYNESYADTFLPSLNPQNKWGELNEEIKSMFSDFIHNAEYVRHVEFVTDSIFKG